MKTSLATTSALIGFVAIGLIAACSEQRQPQPKPHETEPARPEAPPVVVERVLAGAGLPGLSGYQATMLPQAEAERLLGLAYPGQAIRLITVEREGELFNARPLVAFRTPNRIVLIVQNESSQSCHACSGRTSIFYFDTAGSRLIRSFPLVLEGADWGEPQEVRLVDVGGPCLLLRSDYMQMGYEYEGYGLYRLGADSIDNLANFPSLRSNDGTIEPMLYRATLAGAELTVDRGRLNLRYVGRKVFGESGRTERIEQERSVTLDGVDDSWIANWGSDF